MGEADPTIELRIAGHALLNAWHADQNEADVVPVEDVTQVFQGGRVETLRLVEDHQLYIFPGQRAFCCAPMLIDADVDAAEHLVQLVSKRTEVGSDIWCEEEDA